MKLRVAWQLTLLSGMALGWVLPAHAQLATNLTIGNPKAMAMGNAITADSSGIDAVHYNPAALTKLKGRNTTVKVLSGVMDIRADFKARDNYDFIGFTDDPFKNSSSRTLTPTMYLPGMGGMTELPVLVAPMAGVSINPAGSKFTFATNMYTPMALGYSRDSDSDPARFQGRQLSMQRLTYLSPSLAYQVNDELSVGLSIGFSHQALGLNTDFRNPSMLTGIMRLLNEVMCVPGLDEFIGVFINVCGGGIGPFDSLANLDLDLQQSLSPSYNLGILWEPTDWFAWGATYQSESRMNLQGKYRVKYTDDWAGFWSGMQSSLFGAIFSPLFPFGASEEQGNASLKLTYPDAFSTGIKIQPWDKWQFNFDVRWVGYSDWRHYKIEFDRELDLLRIAKNFGFGKATDRTLTLDRGYEDTWSWSVGTQYQLNERLALRAGYEFRPSAIPDDKADVMAPMGDGHLYGFGVGYRWDKDTTIDVGFNYFVAKQSIPAGTSCSVNCEGLDSMVYNPYSGIHINTSVRAYVMAMTYTSRF